jgi:hypothetical protein
MSSQSATENLLPSNPFSKLLANLVHGRHPTLPERLSGFEYFLRTQYHTKIAPLVEETYGPSTIERTAKEVFDNLPIHERDSLEDKAAEVHRKQLQQYEDQLRDLYGFRNEYERDM